MIQAEKELLFFLRLPGGSYSKAMPLEELLQAMKEDGRIGDIYAAIPVLYATVHPEIEVIQEIQDVRPPDRKDEASSEKSEASRTNGTVPKTTRRTKIASKRDKAKGPDRILRGNGRDSEA